MRIVHTCLRYPPALGGTETYVQGLVDHTRNIDAERDVRVLTSRMRTHGPITELDPESLLDNPPYVQRLHHMATPMLSYPRLQALQYYIGHHQPDIIHGYSFWYQPADGAARYVRKHNIPFIFHPIYYENANRKKASWQLYARTIGRRTFATADVVAVISPFEQSLIEAAGFPVKRFELIPPGIDTAPLEQQKQNPFNTRGISGSIILAVSRLAPDKGLEDLIAAMPVVLKTVPNAQLVIIGEDFGLQSTLKQLIEKHGLSNHIHLLGRVDQEELIGAYQYATVFVHPSYYEAFGIVLAEAQAAGTPVIGRDIAAIPYVASPKAGAKLFTTQAELTDAIISFLRNESLRTTAGEQGKAYIKTHFGWPAITQKLGKLYDELV